MMIDEWHVTVSSEDRLSDADVLVLHQIVDRELRRTVEDLRLAGIRAELSQ